MSALQKIKDFLRKILSNQPKLEEGKTVIVPKGPADYEFDDSFVSSLKVAESDLLENNVTFDELDDVTMKKINEVVEKTGKSNKLPIISGKIHDKGFALFEKTDPDYDKDYHQYDIYTEDGNYYSYTNFKQNQEKMMYDEKTKLEDGAEKTISYGGSGKTGSRISMRTRKR